MMKLRILLTSLNLRVEKKFNKTNLDYKLSKDVATQQLKFIDEYEQKSEMDIFCNMEYMECQDEGYLYEFKKANYKRVTALFGEYNRGILCYLKHGNRVDIIKKMEEPHLLHFRITINTNLIDIIAFRVLVSDGKQADFDDRLEQWEKVMKYVDNEIIDKSRLILMGDWNHAYIRDPYIQGTHYQYVFNYQKIKSNLESRDLKMGLNITPGHKEHSYKGYLAIDHIAVGKSITFASQPYYSDYDKESPIGTPDHAFLFAEIDIQ